MTPTLDDMEAKWKRLSIGNHMEWRDAAARVLPLIAECRELREQNERLQQRLLSAAGDDLCRLTQDEIKQMSAGSVKIPPEEIFLESCKRFHAQMANESGVMSNCLTLAQMIAENERLRKALEEIASGGPWGIEAMAIAREALRG